MSEISKSSCKSFIHEYSESVQWSPCPCFPWWKAGLMAVSMQQLKGLAWGEFFKLFRDTGRQRHRYEVFRDFVTMAALSLHNAFNKVEKLEEDTSQLFDGTAEKISTAFRGCLQLSSKCSKSNHGMPSGSSTWSSKPQASMSASSSPLLKWLSSWPGSLMEKSSGTWRSRL